ncbi:SIR2 family protein [uncultured Vibrio sp.]|uniref:SIR2 family protein n=1 Tax=uncultured Vibrio sp. TaxID=114054 RepID=UPI002AA6E24A|nr:SIR2 family protein [uncultured Vibrio sp.]
MSFKEKLKVHFKQFDASPILFVGSGVSRRYLGLECWEDLLKRFSDEIGENHLKLKTQANGDLTEYAKLLANSYSTAWWSSAEAEEVQATHAEHFLNEASPLKISISRYIQTEHPFLEQESLKEELDLLRTANIDGVITTNWDLMMEDIFPKFSVFIGQDGLITGRSHGIAEIYKIHGCSSLPNSLVLTSDDYDKYRKKNPYLSSKLLTMFIERPVIFLGYSLADEHIAEILQDIVDCFPDTSLDFLRDKLLFVEWNPEFTEPEITNSIIHKKIPVKLVQTSSYKDLFSVLSETKKRIPAHLFRTIKDELYDLVLTDDPKGQLYVRSADSVEEESESTEFVVGYGAISMMKKAESLPDRGLVGIQRLDLVREVIFNNGKYDYTTVVSEVFPELCKGNPRVPVFYFLNKANLLEEDGSLKEEVPLCEGATRRFDVDITSFRAAGAEAQRAKGLEEVTQGVNELYQLGDFNLFLRMLPYMPEELIIRDSEDLLDILKKHVDVETAKKSSSNFVRVVCIYDFIMNSNRYPPAIDPLS